MHRERVPAGKTFYLEELAILLIDTSSELYIEKIFLNR